MDFEKFCDIMYHYIPYNCKYIKSMDANTIKVYFDGNCGLCSKEINYYKKIDKKIPLIGLISIMTILTLKNLGLQNLKH